MAYPIRYTMYSIFLCMNIFICHPCSARGGGGGVCVNAVDRVYIHHFPLTLKIHMYTTVAICIHVVYTRFMKIDNELIQLKNQVTKLTGWDLAHMDLSNFLLQKLPAYINHDGRKWFFTMCREISGQDWQVGYETIHEKKLNECIYSQVSDTPIKSILKLIIGLTRGGEL